MYRIAVIADIHFGVKDSEKLYKELKDNFIEVLKEKKPDLIFIAGDLFHNKLSVNSIHNQMCNNFIHDLNDLDGIKILIEGTFLHDQFQLKSFDHYKSNDFRIFLEASVFRYKDLKFLILPEENMLNYKHYYEKLLNDNYDFIIGHGMFSHVGSYTKHETTKTKVMWNVNQFENNVKGLVIFGHIHTRTEYKNVCYPGSFSRDSFGEDEDKGFYIIDYENGKVINKEFIINKDAPKYYSININKIPKSSLEEMLKFLREKSESNDYLRIVVDEEISEEISNNISAFVKNSKNVSIIKKKSKQLQSLEDIKNEKYLENQKRLKKYEGKDIVEITKMIAKEKFNMDFTNEEINTILNEN